MAGLHVIRFMASLKAARDFGLDPVDADAIASRFDPHERDTDHLVEALAAALLRQGALHLPDAV